MLSELIPITFNKVMQTRSYTVIIMEADEKRFALYVEPNIGRAIQMELTEIEKPRPLTHDLLNMIFTGLKITLKQVVITDIIDTTYYARLFIEQEIGDQTHIIEIDARPSDCITLAIMNNTPVYCTPDVLNKTVLIEDDFF
jgi:uncharacterized protein